MNTGRSGPGRRSRRPIYSMWVRAIQRHTWPASPRESHPWGDGTLSARRAPAPRYLLATPQTCTRSPREITAHRAQWESGQLSAQPTARVLLRGAGAAALTTEARGAFAFRGIGRLCSAKTSRDEDTFPSAFTVLQAARGGGNGEPLEKCTFKQRELQKAQPGSKEVA